MEANDKTIAAQHAGTKKNLKIWCGVIITTLVVLSVVAGVIFTRQQKQYRQEILATLLSKISQGEFAETEEIYCSLNEKMRQFVQSEVEQSLMREGIKWFTSEGDSLAFASSSTPFDKVRDLKSLSSVVGVQSLIPLADKALELEEFVPYFTFREIINDNDIIDSIKRFDSTLNLYRNGLADADSVTETLYRCADGYIKEVERVEEIGLEKAYMPELHEFYTQASESYLTLAQGFKENDSVLLEQGRSAVQEMMQMQKTFLENARDMDINTLNIVDELIAMIEDFRSL